MEIQSESIAAWADKNLWPPYRVNIRSASTRYYFQEDYRMRHYSISIALLLLLAGCGGGGGGTTPSGGGTTPSVPIVQQSADGTWNGQFGFTPTKLLVLPNGAFYQWYGTASPLGQLFGSLMVDTSNNIGFSSSTGEFNGLLEQNWLITSSTITSKSILTFTETGGILSNKNTSRTLSFVYDPTYDTPMTLTDLTGNYSGVTMGQSSTFSIDGLGAITGVNGACSLNGTVTPNISKGYATVSAIISGVNCFNGINGGSHIGYLIKSGRGIGQQIWIGLFQTPPLTGYGYSLVGAKQ